MKDIVKGLGKLACGLLGVIIAFPIAEPVAHFLVTLEPVAKFYDLILYYIDKLIGVFM